MRTKAAKERLRLALAAGNLEKTMAAPVTVIIAYDLCVNDLPIGKIKIQFAVNTLQDLDGLQQVERVGRRFAELNGCVPLELADIPPATKDRWQWRRHLDSLVA